MFDDLQEPKDMFSDVPDPKTPPPSPAPAPSLASPQPQASIPASVMTAEGSEKTGLGIRLIAMVLVSLACVGGAGYLVYRVMVRDAVPQEVNEVLGGAPEAPPPSDTETLPDGKGSEDDTLTEPIAVVDSDGDGLTNDEERIAGTSVAKADTDNDGLGDREEIKVYGTDPKKMDTDGDTYSDGEEVQNGYNPNGTGKLLNLPE